MAEQPSFRELAIASFLNNQKSQDPSQASVCRCLFGPRNPELNSRVARESMEQHSQQMRAKYNFDFRSETPLRGKFKWETLPLADTGNVPKFYREKTVDKHCVSVNSGVSAADSCSTDESVVSSQPVTAATSSAPEAGHVTSQDQENARSRSSAATVTSQRGKRKAFITDYFPIKKSRQLQGESGNGK